MRLGSWKPKFMKTWFMCGVCFGLIAMVLSVFLLTIMVVNTIKQKPVEQQVLTPVVSTFPIRLYSPHINIHNSDVSQ